MTRRGLRSEQIYEAMVDDQAFAELPSLLAESLGARSCTIHWRDTGDNAEVLAHSRYFTDDQMLRYADHFTGHDDWTNRARERVNINRVWNAEELVSRSDYESGVFFNEWIRGMGDDTAHCMGSVMETGQGLGIVGLHRGRTQDTFDPDTVAALRRNIVHLRRTMTVRARLVREADQRRDLAALLDRNPSPMFAIDARRRLAHANAAGEHVLQGSGLIEIVNGELRCCAPGHDAALALAVSRALDPASPEAGLVVVGAPDGRRMELTVAPVTERGARLVLVSGRDPEGDIRRQLAPSDPRDTLAPRELLVARAVAMGLRNREIAERLGLTEGTVKVYLHNLYAKVGISSRTELALRLGRAEDG